jgi:hypothetical protein
MPRTTGVFVKRAAKRKRSNRRVAKRRVKRRLTNAKIKDIVSRKKRDTMLAYSPFQNAGSTGTLTLPIRGQSFQKRGGTEFPHFNLWCASYRKLATTDFDSVRTARSVYLKGLSETYRVEVFNAPWQWRRIVFRTKDRFIGANAQSPTYATPAIGGFASSNVRMVGQGLTTPGQPAFTFEGQTTAVPIEGIVFKGATGVDWVNPFNAPIDKQRIKLLSDQKFRVASGNESGAAKIKKFYTPLNTTITYDDDEAGVEQFTSGFASDSDKWGNVYVLDIFWNEAGDDASLNDMLWTANSTMYWHEH